MHDKRLSVACNVRPTRYADAGTAIRLEPDCPLALFATGIGTQAMQPVIFINRYFYPDQSATSQILTDLAFALAEAGIPVTVLTSRQLYEDERFRLPPRENVRGVAVVRLWTTRFGRRNLVGRAVDYMTFYFSVVFSLLRRARKGSVVVAKTDPPLLSVVVAPVVALKRARLVNWLQDLFPEIAEVLQPGRGFVTRLGYRVLRSLRDLSLRGAAMNVAIGSIMADRIAALGVPRSRITVIPNWADGTVIYPVAAAANALRKDWELGDAFVVGYSGNLGRAHDYATILEAIGKTDRTMPGRRPIAWLFIGGGAGYEALKAACLRLKLGSVLFKPYQPRERLAESLSVADVHLISLRPELEGLVVPSKLYAACAAGRPSLFIGSTQGEVARCLIEADAGRVTREGEGAALANTVMEMSAHPDKTGAQATNARALFDRVYEKQRVIPRWQALLADLSR